jgi:hypothetical protein
MPNIVEVFTAFLLAPISVIILVFGLILIILGLSGTIKGWINIPINRQSYAIIGGILLLMTGLLIAALPNIFPRNDLSFIMSDALRSNNESIKIDNISKFNRYIAGKEFTHEQDRNNKLTWNYDNTIIGQIGQSNAKGLWAFTKNGYCREFIVVHNTRDYSCSDITYINGSVAFISRDTAQIQREVWTVR